MVVPVLKTPETGLTSLPSILIKKVEPLLAVPANHIWSASVVCGQKAVTGPGTPATSYTPHVWLLVLYVAREV